MMAKAQKPECPEFMNDKRLEDAFKSPEYSIDGHYVKYWTAEI